MPYNMRKFNGYSCIFLLFFSLNTRLSKKENFEIKERQYFLSNEKIPEYSGILQQVISRYFTFLQYGLRKVRTGFRSLSGSNSILQ